MGQSHSADLNTSGALSKELLRFRLAQQLGADVITPLKEERKRPAKSGDRLPPKKTILVIDDEPSTLELVSSTLNEHQFEVLTALSVREGINILQSYSEISLVLTDLKMPMEDGFAILEFVRDNLRFQHIPVIVFTSSSHSDHVTRAIELGASDYLSKPLIPQTLVERLIKVIGSSIAKVLLVTDLCISAAALKRALTSAGFDMRIAMSGREALESIRGAKADIVISDTVLSDMTGIDFFLAAKEITLGLPFLFIKDPRMKVSDSSLRAAGVHGVINRPFHNTEIVRLLRSIVHRSS